jgi:signal peptidase I
MTDANKDSADPADASTDTAGVAEKAANLIEKAPTKAPADASAPDLADAQEDEEEDEEAGAPSSKPTAKTSAKSSRTSSTKSEKSADYTIPPLHGEVSAGRGLLRVVRAFALYFVLPALGAATLQWALTPPSGVEATGALAMVRSAVRDQPVPFVIGLFTLFATAAWFARHRLPLASAVYPKLPAEAARDLGPAFERARSLVEECRELLTRPNTAIEPFLRAKVAAGARDLVSAMQAPPFVEAPFVDALVKLDQLLLDHFKKFRKSEFREVGESVFVAVMCAMLLRTFAFEAFKIPTSSMVPTLMVGDHIFVNKFSYGPTIPFLNKRVFTHMPPDRGDVMVFRFPERPEQDFIKRVIALPGDTLEAKNGHPWINGWEVPSCFAGVYVYSDPESSLKHEADLFVEFLGDEAFFTLYDHAAGMFPETQGPFIVKPEEVMVMGDNRRNSHDSRFWNAGQGGGVPYDNIKGRALVVWLSFTEAKMDWSRVGAPVMGRPSAPKAMSSLGPAVEKCLKDRPPMDKTTPPGPSK